MKCVIADFSGFCHGVKDTVDAIESLLKDNSSKKVSCIGLPVHNPQVTNRLKELGLNVVESLDDVDSGTLVIRAHGLPPQTIFKAQEKRLEIIDTTCGIVKNVQRIAEKLNQDGYTVIIAGEAKHPEVKAIYGYTSQKGIICTSLDEVRKVEIRGKVGIVSQTTFSKKIFKDMVHLLTDQKFSEMRVFDTICNSIAKRSTSAIEVAKSVDTMLVVGGRMSSNTKRLFEICTEYNPKTHHVETEAEIDLAWFAAAQSFGLTAGASTPQWIIDRITEYIAKR